VQKKNRPVPTLIDNLGLWNLRHRLGYKEDSTFASCSRCMKVYTYEDLVGLYCQKNGGIEDRVSMDTNFEAIVSIPKCQMHALCFEFQKHKGASVKDTPVLAIHAAYNSHSSSMFVDALSVRRTRSLNTYVAELKNVNAGFECRIDLGSSLVFVM
jgi:hypothetical protein